MGCASSTPMVATAGSEMLKAATHVAGDVKQKGEEALEDATETFNATVETAKESVGTAVAGITNELGNAFKNGTDAIDGAKHKVMEGLQMETRLDAGKASEPEMGGASRAPTPVLEADVDSLKTSTPEPEIERALANSLANDQEAPPTPKPFLQELAKLSVQVDAVDAVVATAAAADTTPTAAANVESRWYRRMEDEEEQRRPSTTEWEKLADQLAKSRKFKPYESFAHSQNQFSVYKDYTSLRDKPGHYDGHFSGGNSQQSSASQSQSDLSSGHLTPAPPTRRGHRDYAKFVGSEQPTSVSRASSRLSNVGAVNGRTFDFNSQRERINLPISTGRIVGNRVGSAFNGRRSVWARGQPEVLPEEPHHTYSPIRRSSMTIGLGQPMRFDRKERNVELARSTSNLTSSSLPSKAETKKKEKSRLFTADVSKNHLLGSRRPHEPAHKDIVDLRLQRIVSSKPEKLKKSEETVGSKQKKTTKDMSANEIKLDLNEGLKSMVLDSARDISSTVLLATPLMATSALQSPVKANSHIDRSQVCSPIPIPTNNKMSAVLVSRTSTFITNTTPIRTPQVNTPTRINSKVSKSLSVTSKMASPNRENMDATLQATVLNTSAAMTPRKTPNNIKTNVESTFAFASRSSSRLSSASSTEVVIKPLSHLNTPRAISISPGSSQVVMTEYEDLNLEAALAQLVDWRGSTTTLHSLQSSNSRIGPSSHNSLSVDSRRTSPWSRSHVDHSQNNDNRTFFKCGIAERSSPSKTLHKPLERCEICCNEIVIS